MDTWDNLFSDSTSNPTLAIWPAILKKWSLANW
jgi:hypothetical protein